MLGAKFLRRIAWGGHQSTHSPHTDVTFGVGDRRIVLSLFHGDPTMLATDGPGLVHFAFRCNDMAELDAWKRHLESKNVPCELMGHLNLGPISVYFSDPWGYRLEITTKVPDWQAAKIEPRKTPSWRARRWPAVEFLEARRNARLKRLRAALASPAAWSYDASAGREREPTYDNAARGAMTEGGRVSKDGEIDGLTAKYATIDGLRTRYYDVGSENAEPMVLCHGGEWSGGSAAPTPSAATSKASPNIFASSPMTVPARG